MPALLIIPTLLLAGIGGAGFFVYRKFTGRAWEARSVDGRRIWELEATRPVLGSEWTVRVRVFKESGWPNDLLERWTVIGTAADGPAAMKVGERWLRDRGLWQ